MTLSTKRLPADAMIELLCNRLVEAGFVNNIPGQYSLPGSNLRVRTNYVHGEWTVTVRDATKQSRRHRIPATASNFPDGLLYDLETCFNRASSK